MRGYRVRAGWRSRAFAEIPRFRCGTCGISQDSGAEMTTSDYIYLAFASVCASGVAFALFQAFCIDRLERTEKGRQDYRQLLIDLINQLADDKEYRGALTHSTPDCEMGSCAICKAKEALGNDPSLDLMKQAMRRYQ